MYTRTLKQKIIWLTRHNNFVICTRTNLKGQKTHSWKKRQVSKTMLYSVNVVTVNFENSNILKCIVIMLYICILQYLHSLGKSHKTNLLWFSKQCLNFHLKSRNKVMMYMYAFILKGIAHNHKFYQNLTVLSLIYLFCLFLNICILSMGACESVHLNV